MKHKKIKFLILSLLLLVLYIQVSKSKDLYEEIVTINIREYKESDKSDLFNLFQLARENKDTLAILELKMQLDKIDSLISVYEIQNQKTPDWVSKHNLDYYKMSNFILHYNEIRDIVTSCYQQYSSNPFSTYRPYTSHMPMGTSSYQIELKNLDKNIDSTHFTLKLHGCYNNEFGAKLKVIHKDTVDFKLSECLPETYSKLELTLIDKVTGRHKFLDYTK